MAWRKGPGYSLVALLLLLLAWPLHARHALTLDAATDGANLIEYTHALHDPHNRVGLQQAIAAQRAGQFRTQRDRSAGFDAGTYWLHVTVINRDPSQTQWLLLQRFALLDRIQVYVVQPDGRIAHGYGGNVYPFPQRAVQYRYPVFALDIPPDVPVELFIQLRSRGSMQFDLALYRPAAFAEDVAEAQLGLGIYYGILIALLVYNFALWLNLRESDYFWYVFHIVAFGLAMLTYNGLGYQYLWPASPRLAQMSMPLAVSLAQVGMHQFARHFLELRQRWPLGDRISLALIAVAGALALSVLAVSDGGFVRAASSAMLLVTVSWLTIASVVVLRNGYAPARMFLAAWTLLLLGTAMFAAMSFGLLPRVFITEYGIQIGSTTEMLLLSLALGSRYASLRTENERIVRESQRKLEGEVSQRTAELRHALIQLGEAHARLRESSRRDGLTGLLTRSHFREAFTPLLLKAREAHQPLSVLMIDVDHFKRINDTHGHLVGDECLRWAAHAIGQSLRPFDALLARFGGEEFVVALPGRDRDAAVAVAEQVRLQLASEPCSGDDYSIDISASIGVHQVDPYRERGLDAALQHADEALYRAKNDGRNCVRAS